MADGVRHRHAIISVALDNVSIHNYQYNPKDFELPSWLKVPRDLVHVMESLHQRARIAIKSMRDIMTYRDKRYNALCPSNMGLIYDLHTFSIKQLLEWKEQSDPEDPTLAPAAKIPRRILKFTFDPHNYNRFCNWYLDNVKNFMAGPYSAYTQTKFQTSILASQLLDQHAYGEWRHWWDGTFAPAMWKWEACLEGLILPMWEDIMDDIYLMLLDRVEDADPLANTLCSSCSPPATPPTHKVVEDYFYRI